MAALGKADFFVGSEPKTASTGKYAGKTRTEIVLEKIKNKNLLSLGSIEDIRYIFLLEEIL